MSLKFNPTNGKLDLVSDLSTLPATYLKLDASNDPIVGDLLIKPTTNSTTTFQIQPSGSTTPVLNVDTTNGRVGIGTTAPIGRLDIQGLAVNDLPTYSAEFLLGTGWTSTDWTGSFATGWTHTVGNVSVLSQSKVAVNATKYQIAYTVTGRTAGSFTIGFGGQTSDAISATGAWGPTTSSTASLTITPTTDFNGAIVVSIKSLTAVSTPLVNLKSSDGTVRIEMRANTGTNNTFLGIGSGQYNTTSSYNTSVGVNSLRSNTTGNQNSAFGNGTLYSNTTGSQSNAFGNGALYSNTTGIFNTANGAQSLRSNTTGSYNTVLGFNAGRYLANGVTGRTTGNNGLYLGYNTNSSVNGTDNEIVIGYNAIGKGSNTAVYGNTSMIAHIFEAGNVGIGTTAPNANALLDVSSTTKAFMPPRMTTAQKAAIASLTEGMVVWDSTLHVLAVYNGTAWQSVTAV